MKNTQTAVEKLVGEWGELAKKKITRYTQQSTCIAKVLNRCAAEIEAAIAADKASAALELQKDADNPYDFRLGLCAHGIGAGYGWHRGPHVRRKDCVRWEAAAPQQAATPKTPMVGSDALRNGNDHFGLHERNNFCEKYGCKPQQAAGERSTSPIFNRSLCDCGGRGAHTINCNGWLDKRIKSSGERSCCVDCGTPEIYHNYITSHRFRKLPPEVIAGIEEGHADMVAGRTVPFEQVRKSASELSPSPMGTGAPSIYPE